MPFDPSGVPEIAPGAHGLFGHQVQIVANVDPELFPNGLEMIVMVPGSLEPFGKIMCPPGAMLAAIPDQMAAHIRKEIKKQAPTILGGQVAAPGFN